MRFATAAATLVCALVGPLHGADAEPTFGTSIGYGDALGPTADERVTTAVYGYAALPGGWTIGGELTGSMEAYTGGYGCSTGGSGDMVVPSVAVSCLQPGVGLHALFGTRAAPSPTSRLRLEVGVGASTIFLLPGQGGDASRDTVASGLVRAAYLARLGRAFTGDWWLGLQLEERALGWSDPRSSRALGLVLEASSFD